MVIFFFLSLGLVAQTVLAQKTKTEKEVNQWKEGFIILKNGTQYFGDIRCFVKSGSLSDHIEFRKDRSDFSQIFLANTCQSVQWGDLELISLPNNTRKHRYDKLFCMTSFIGGKISLFFEPKFTKSSKPKSLRFILLKEGVYTTVTRANFKRTMSKLFADSSIWKQKSANKQWFSYANIHEVAKFYDDNFILVSTDYED